MEAQLKKYNREILKFEKKYGHTFKEFERMWDEGKIEDKHSNEIEDDFMDWEMMEMEKNARQVVEEGIKDSKAGRTTDVRDVLKRFELPR